LWKLVDDSHRFARSPARATSLELPAHASHIVSLERFVVVNGSAFFPSHFCVNSCSLAARRFFYRVVKETFRAKAGKVREKCNESLCASKVQPCSDQLRTRRSFQPIQTGKLCNRSGIEEKLRDFSSSCVFTLEILARLFAPKTVNISSFDRTRRSESFCDKKTFSSSFFVRLFSLVGPQSCIIDCDRQVQLRNLHVSTSTRAICTSKC
jgi:hypothetical protein